MNTGHLLRRVAAIQASRLARTQPMQRRFVFCSKATDGRLSDFYTGEPVQLAKGQIAIIRRRAEAAA